MLALADNDTLGLACPTTLESPPTYSCPEQVWESFYKPATDRLVNYDSFNAIGAVQSMTDKTNPVRLPGAVPAGMSQLSHLPEVDEEECADNDWFNSIEELSDDEDYHDSRRVLSRHYNELSEAFNN